MLEVMARKEPPQAAPPASIQVAFRLTPDVVEWLDRKVASMRAEWPDMNRSDVIRGLIRRAMLADKKTKKRRR
jgi:hypothetical protein